MQATPVTSTNPEIKKSSAIEEVLHALPQELLGVMPETVWQSLSVDQKKEILTQNNLYEKYVPAVTEAAPVQEVPEPQQIQSPEVVVEQAQRPEETTRSPEFADAVKEAQKVEEDHKEEVLPQEDQARVDAEAAASQNNDKSSWGAKIFGYTASEETIQNSEDISANGNLEDGRTWTATLIRKILAVFGQ